MITAAQCLRKFGSPEQESFMTIWSVPQVLGIGPVPRRIYCHKLMAPALERAFGNLIVRGHADELRTWDGCFNIRRAKGSSAWSLHAWGLAVDVNAAWNRFGKPPTLSPGFVECFTDAGFDWGGYWRRPDGMHFQLASIE